MRNFKKILSLVLCMAMMLSVMVVGAGAAFSDQNQIKNTEAVDACVALNIINGYTDGSFRPEGTITRAEACKMICVALNGGKEPALGTSANASFTDTKGHWAEGYIESCVAQGIVAGIGGGKFAPNATVTASQFAKMLLIALGYNADNQGYVGDAWEVNVNVDASAKGLYEDLSGMDPSKALTRDNAAQMIWNTLNAYEVEYSYNLVTENGSLVSKLTVDDKTIDGSKITMLEDKYEAYAITGTLTTVKKDNGKDTYNITVINAKHNGSEYGKDGEVTYTDVLTDYSALRLQNVRVLVKPDKNGKDAVVYGVYATDKNTEQNGLLVDMEMDGNKVKLNGVKYDLAKESNTMVFVNGEQVEDTSIKDWVTTYGDESSTKYTDKAYMQPTAVQLLAVDGTTDYSILKVTTFAVGQVTGVGSDYVNISVKNGDRSFISGSKCEDDSWNWYSDIEKDDYVLLTAEGNYADGKGVISKADIVSGKITGVKGNDKVTVDGTQYTMAGKGTAITKAPTLNSKVDMIVIDGYVYYTDTQTGAVDDIALLVEAGQKSGLGSKWEARLIFADGSDKTVDIEKYWEDEDNKGNKIPAISEADGGILVSYEKSGDTYTLTKLGEDKTYDQGNDPEFAAAGYDAYIEVEGGETDGSIKNADVTAKDNNGNTIENVSRVYYDNDATVFVKYDADQGADASYKVVTGKTASSYEKNIDNAAALADKSGNSYYGKVVFLDMSSQTSTGGSSDKTYAVATTDWSKDSSSGSTLYQVTGWNGSESIVFKTEDSISIQAGDIFEYSDAGNDLYDLDKVKDQDDYYVYDYDEGSGDIALIDSDGTLLVDTDKLNKTSVDDDDTVVLFVDSDAGIGVMSGVIELAYRYDADFWTGGALGEGELTEDNAPNVRCYFDDDDYITVIVVDINRNITEW